MRRVKFQEIIYNFYGNADIIIENSLIPKKDLFKFGMQMDIPKEYDTITWYGCGPHENYSDRNTGASVSRYSMNIEDYIHDYIRPQENSNRCDVRWVSMTNKEGDGFLISGMPVLSISAWPYSLDDLEFAQHANELPRRENITFNIDFKQKGVGTKDSWGKSTHANYRLMKDFPLYYSFRFSPYKKDMGDLDLIGKRILPIIED